MVLAMGKQMWGVALLMQLMSLTLHVDAARNTAQNSFLSSMNVVTQPRFPMPNELVDKIPASAPEHPALNNPFHEVYSLKSTDGGIQRFHYAVDDNGFRGNIHSNFLTIPQSDSSLTLPWSDPNVENRLPVDILPAFKESDAPRSDFLQNNDFLITPKWISSLNGNEVREDTTVNKEITSEVNPRLLAENQLIEDGLASSAAFGTYGQRMPKSEVGQATNYDTNRYRTSGVDYTLFPPYSAIAYSGERVPSVPAYPEVRSPNAAAYPEQRSPSVPHYPEERSPSVSAYPEQRSPSVSDYLEVRSPSSQVYPEQRSPNVSAYPEERSPSVSAYSEARSHIVPAYHEARSPTVPEYHFEKLSKNINSIFERNEDVTTNEKPTSLGKNLPVSLKTGGSYSDGDEKFDSQRGEIPFQVREPKTLEYAEVQKKQSSTPEAQNSAPKLLDIQGYKPRIPKKKATEKQNKLELESFSRAVSPVFDISNDKGRFYYYVYGNEKPVESSVSMKSQYYSTGDALLQLLNETGVSYKDRDFLFSKSKTGTVKSPPKNPPKATKVKKNEESKNISKSESTAISREYIDENLKNIIQHLEVKIQEEQTKNKLKKNPKNVDTVSSPTNQQETSLNGNKEITPPLTGVERTNRAEVKTNSIHESDPEKAIDLPILENITDQNVVFITIPKIALNLQEASYVASTTSSSENETAGTQSVSESEPTSEKTMSSIESTTFFPGTTATDHVFTVAVETAQSTSQTSESTSSVTPDLLSNQIVDKTTTNLLNELTTFSPTDSVATSQDAQTSQASTDIYTATELPTYSTTLQAAQDSVFGDSSAEIVQGNVANVSSQNNISHDSDMFSTEKLTLRPNSSFTAGALKNATDPEKESGAVVSDSDDAPMMVIKVKDMEDLKTQLLGLLQVVGLEKVEVSEEQGNSTDGLFSYTENTNAMENTTLSDKPGQNSESVISESIFGENAMLSDQAVPKSERLTSTPITGRSLSNDLDQRNGIGSHFSIVQNEPQIVMGVPTAVGLAESHVPSSHRTSDYTHAENLENENLRRGDLGDSNVDYTLLHQTRDSTYAKDLENENLRRGDFGDSNVDYTLLHQTSDSTYADNLENDNLRRGDFGDSDVDYTLLHPGSSFNLGESENFPAILYDSSYDINRDPGSASDIFILEDRNYQGNGTSDLNLWLSSIPTEVGHFREYLEHEQREQAESQHTQQVQTSYQNNPTYAEAKSLHEAFLRETSRGNALSSENPTAQNVEFMDFDSSDFRRSRPLENLDSQQLRVVGLAPDDVFNPLSENYIDVIEIIDYVPNDSITQETDPKKDTGEHFVDAYSGDFKTTSGGSRVTRQISEIHQDNGFKDMFRGSAYQNPQQQQVIEYEPTSHHEIDSYNDFQSQRVQFNPARKQQDSIDRNQSPIIIPRERIVNRSENPKVFEFDDPAVEQQDAVDRNQSPISIPRERIVYRNENLKMFDFNVPARKQQDSVDRNQRPISIPRERIVYRNENSKVLDFEDLAWKQHDSVDRNQSPINIPRERIVYRNENSKVLDIDDTGVSSNGYHTAISNLVPIPLQLQETMAGYGRRTKEPTA